MLRGGSIAQQNHPDFLRHLFWRYTAGRPAPDDAKRWPGVA